MTADRPELTVQVRSIPALGGWRARFRPCGPAGELTVQLPLGLTVWLDAAEPELVLEVSAREAAPAAAGLLGVLFGDQAAALARQEESGEAPYAPAEGHRARALLALLVALGTADERPAITAIALAEHARRLAEEQAGPEGAEAGLGLLLDRIATVQALRAVLALRALPPRSALGLTPEQEATLDRAIALVADLAGEHVRLGPVSEPPPEPAAAWSESTGSGQDWESGLTLRPIAERSLQRRSRTPATGPGSLIDVQDCPLPLVVHDLRLTEPKPGGYQIEAELTFAELDEDGTPVELAPPDSSLVAPQVWARAVRRHDGVVLYLSRCLIDGARLTASLRIKPEYRYPNQFWIELISSPDTPVRSGDLRRFEQAAGQGARAAALQRSATEPEQWAAVGRVWLDCAKLWSWVEDSERQALAVRHAARAFLAAGPLAATEAASAARQVGALPPVDSRWMAPDVAQQAERDPLQVDTLVRLAGLGDLTAQWAMAELERAVRSVVPPLRGEYLKQMLNLLPLSPGPAEARIRQLRARARVGLAHRASEQPETLPLASALMALASAEWPYLDSLGRQRFAAVNLRLLQAGLDAAAPDGAP